MKKLIVLYAFYFFTSAFIYPQVTQEWVARYNGPGNGDDYARSLVVDDSGNVYITGYSWGGGTYVDYATIKYNSSGVQQWIKRYNAVNRDDYALSIAVDGSGNVYVTGHSQGSVIANDFDYATIHRAFSSGSQDTTVQAMAMIMLVL